MDAGEPVVLLGDSGTGKSHYADLRVMPTWPLNPLRSRVIGLARSA
jgi:ABC-type arginine transport system ATPase subunit